MTSRLFRFVITAATLTALLAVPMAAQVKDHRDIEFPPLPEFRIQKPETYTLGNGMTVFLQEDHELPLINVTARIRTGSDYEPADKAGLAGLMATVQRTGGTASMTGDEIDEYLEVRAASVETGMQGDVGLASMSCLKDDFDDVFRIFSDVLRTPTFAEDKLEVAKVQVSAGIARRNDSIGAVVAREFARLVYGPDSPLVRMPEYATVASIKRDDLVAFHKKYTHPNNVFLGIVGDFDSEKIKARIQEVFGDWSRGPDFDPPEVPYRKEPTAGVFFIEKPDVTQANIRIGHLGIETANPDYFAVQVMNEVLGGGFWSRMFSNVRTKKGLAYNVFGSVGASFSQPGIFQVGMQTKSSTMAAGVEALKEEIVGMIENPPTEEELKRAKESILNSFIFNYDSKSEILGQQMTYAYHGLPADFLERYRANIEKVTRDDVIRVAKKYIHPGRLTLLVVGKSADFDRPVDTFGDVASIDISIPPPPDTSPRVAKTEESAAEGARILAKAVRALGGSNPGATTAIRMSTTMAMSMGGQSISLGQDALLVFPDKIHVVMKTPMGEQTLVLNGDRGFAMGMGQVQELPAEAIDQAKKDFGRDLSFLVRYHDDPDLEAVAAGEEEVDGVRYEIVAVTLRGSESRLWVAPDGTVQKQAYQGNHPLQRTPGYVEKHYSDYREVDGRQVSHRQVVEFEGEEVMSVTVKSLEFDPEVDAAAFEKQES